ncbi:kinase-like protein [Rhizophagus irregularis]|uniref:Kinase-like protein n=1 Tax=Rhizophagus irregularis TaxID=588596 RepID=A0A2I1HAP3_9GLOM|nr:kinase-like protein [Rhizophagus irregularis]
MDQSNKSNKTSLINNQKQNIFTPNLIYRKCNECNKNRKKFDKTQQICHLCIKAKTIPLSGNKVIDYEKDRRMEFVPFDNFKDVSFVAEGGFSKIYKSIWINGPITNWSEKKQKYNRRKNMTVALKELNNSKNLNSKELNELKIYYSCKYRTAYINKYYGVTQNPATKNFMIITNYYELGDLTHYITNNFFNITWKDKLSKLFGIITGLKLIHDSHIIHKDYHSGNIFINPSAITGDLGLSKSSLGNDEDNEIYEGKRKFNDSLFKADEINKKIKLPENNDYSTTEFELDIDINIDIQSNNNDYITEEINFDIDIPAEGKRKFNDSLFKADEINKKIKLSENNDYLTTELELDIDIDIQSNNNDYITEEINLDIDIPAG